jgi:hypothetical protein
MFIVKRDPGKMMMFLAEGKSDIAEEERLSWFGRMLSWLGQMMFLAAGKSNIAEEEPPNWFDHRWEYVCGESRAEAANK